MELFIPSVLVLVVSFLLLAFVVPRLSPYMLGGLCVLMFALGVWQHYTMFPYEYRTSMVTDMLTDYSGFIMLIAIIFSGLIVMYLFNGSSAANLVPASLVPDMGIPTSLIGNSKNSSMSIFNSGNSGVTGVLNNASKSISNLMKSTNQTKSNNLVSPSFKVS